MTLQMVRFTASQANMADIQTAIEAMIVAIHEAQLVGTRFVSCRLNDGVTFLNMLELTDGVGNPLPGVPRCQVFQQQLSSWVAEPPTLQAITGVGSSRFFE